MEQIPLIRPLRIRYLNWIGLRTLYVKEVQRYFKVIMQTLLAPVITAALFMLVFSVAIGGRVSPVDGVGFIEFLAPGLVMMGVLQNAFANTSSSLVIGKMQGNIVDLLMPPLGPGEVLAAMVAAGVTRGLSVGLVTALVLGVLGGGGWPTMLWLAVVFGVLGSCFMALLGMIAGMWAIKHDSLAAITNFIVQPLAFLSGTFYSVDRLPAPFDMIASINPVFMAIDGFRYAMIGISDRPYVTSMIILLLLNAIVSVLCYHLLARGWRLKS
jgi:ABC-2 type transport system permease protein